MGKKSRECLFQAHKDESKPSMISGGGEIRLEKGKAMSDQRDWDW